MRESHGPPAYVVIGPVPVRDPPNSGRGPGQAERAARVRGQQVVDDLVLVRPGGGLRPGRPPAAGPARPGRRPARAAPHAPPTGITGRHQHRRVADQLGRARRPGVLTSGSPASSASWATSARASQVEVSSARSAASSSEPRSSRCPSRRDRQPLGRDPGLQPRPLRPLPHDQEHQPGVRRYAGRDVQHQAEVLLRGQPGHGQHQRRLADRGRAGPQRRSRARWPAGSAGAATGSQPGPPGPEPRRLGHQVAAGAEREVGPAGHQPLQQPGRPAPDRPEPARRCARSPPAGTRASRVDRHRQRAGLVTVGVHHVGTAEPGQVGQRPDVEDRRRSRGPRRSPPGRTPGPRARGPPAGDRCWPRAGRSRRCWRSAPVRSSLRSHLGLGARSGAVARAGRPAPAPPAAAHRRTPPWRPPPGRPRPRRPRAGRRRPAAEPAAAPAPPASMAPAAPPTSAGSARRRLGRPGRAGPAASRPRRR